VSILEKKACPSIKVSQQVHEILQLYKASPTSKVSIVLKPLYINISNPWGYFDWACQGIKNIYGLGFTLFISQTHYIYGKFNIGYGTNNLAELSALFSLLNLIGVFSIGQVLPHTLDV
jgi:hypothetical protein